MNDDVVHRLALSFKKDDLAGMYALANKRESDLKKELAKLKEQLEKAENLLSNMSGNAAVDSYFKDKNDITGI